MSVTPTRQRAAKKIGNADANVVRKSGDVRSATGATTRGHSKEPPAVETSNATQASLTPAPSKKTATPHGKWSLAVDDDAHSMKFQLAQFDRILRSGLPGRAELVEIVIGKRCESAHAYYRGIADSRTRLMAKELPVDDYPGGAGFAISTGDWHFYQPATVEHATKGVLLGVGDSDRIGFGPYEWDVRSMCTSIELEGRARGFPPELRDKAMRAALAEYRASIESVATAGDMEDQEAAAKALRVHDDPDDPTVLRDTVDAAVTKKHEEWVEKHVVIVKTPDGKRAQLPREGGVLHDVPDIPPGARARIQNTIANTLPAYAKQLSPPLDTRLEGLEIVDLAMPIKGNGSLGYGRWQVLLADPKHPTDVSRLVILELKEQLPSELSKTVGQRRTGAVYGTDQHERAVSLYKLGLGKSTAPSWGTVRLPGCGVESDAFTVKEISEVARGIDPSKLNRTDFVAMAVAQARLLAGFQALAGVGHSYGVGNAADILKHIDKPGRDFVAENVAGAQKLATHWESEQKQFAVKAKKLLARLHADDAKRS